MCLTIPKKVIKVKESQAQVESKAGKSWVKTHLIESVKKGDWLLVQADLALKKISYLEAKEIIKILQNAKQD